MALLVSCQENNNYGISKSVLFGTIMLLLTTEMDYNELGAITLDIRYSPETLPSNSLENTYKTITEDEISIIVEDLFHIDMCERSQTILFSPFEERYPSGRMIDYIDMYVDAIMWYVLEVRHLCNLTRWDNMPYIVIDSISFESSIVFID